MIKVINFECFSEQGIRENNEDYLLPHNLKQQQRVFVLCDGMGGHGHGEVASQTVCESIYAFLSSQIECENHEFTEYIMQQALDFAIEELTKADTFVEEGRRMGTTLVVVLLNQFDILIGHVGDSRCYLFDKDWNKVFCTQDHSEVAEAVRRGFITEQEAFDHPKKNIITRSVQAGKHTEIEVDVLKNISNDYSLLLCTDGVSDALRDSEIEALLFRPTTSERLSGVKEECTIKSRDNFSAILIQMLQDEISPEPMKKAALPEEEHKREEQKERKPDTYCRHCGTEMMAGAKFCPCCGKDVLQSENVEATLPEEDQYWDLGLIKVKKPASVQWKIPKMRWPFGIIVILILLNGFLFYRMNHLSDKQGRDFTLTNCKNEEKNRQIQTLDNANKNLKQENDLLRKNVKVLTDSIIKLNGDENLQ